MSQLTQHIGHLYLSDYKYGLDEQHKPWELAKMSVWQYLTDFKENNIILLVSQKRSQILGKKHILCISHNVFYGWLKFYEDLIK